MKNITEDNCCSGSTNSKPNFSNLKPVNNSGCCSTDDINCCGTNNTEEEKTEAVDFDIKIDGKNINVKDASKNIVDIAKAAGISIPAPCYLARKKNGCCNACVVEINSKQHYACGTKPKANMDIIVNREDLALLRKERLLKYRESIRRGTPLKCGNE